MLPGMAPQPGLVAGGGGPSASISYIGHVARYQADAVLGNITCPYPAGIVAGDLLFVIRADYSTSGNPSDPGDPAGFTRLWTQVPSTALNGQRCQMWVKVAETSDISGSVTLPDADSNAYVVTVAFKTNASSATATAFAMSASVNVPSNIVVTASGQQPPTIVVAHYNGSVTTLTRGMSPAKDNEIGPFTARTNIHGYFAWKIYNNGVAENVTISMDDSGARNFLQAAYVKVTP